YDAQELLRKHTAELGIGMVEFKMMVYAKEQDAYFPDDQVPAGASVLNISGTEQRELLNAGKDIPAWFTYPEVVEELRHQFPPRRAQGFTVLAVGPAPAAPALAGGLLVKLLELGTRAVTLLGGDDPKAAADPDAGKIAWLAGEIAKHGGAAVGWVPALDEAGRAAIRKRVEAEGGCLIVDADPATPAPAAVAAVLAQLTSQGFIG